LVKTQVIIPATVEFVDIAGLVQGASRGEGLGNKFLSHIREVDALIHVVRCFEEPNVHHVAGAIDPVRDIQVVITELVLADLEAVQKRIAKLVRDDKRGDKTAHIEMTILHKLEPHLNAGKTADTLALSKEERAIAKGFFLLTDKPTLFAANVLDTDLAKAESNPHVQRVREYARTHHGCDVSVISAQIESDLIDLSAAEELEYLRALGVSESGVTALIRNTYHLLGLRTFFTATEKEVRAWTIHAGDPAPKAAGVIHSDFERGFIRAETLSCEMLLKCGSMAHAREKGLCRMEGKDYQVQDGDVIHFKFHV
jgi:ribosome-binding ATPase